MRFSWVLGLVIVIVGAVGHAQGNGKSARIADEDPGRMGGLLDLGPMAEAPASSR